MARRDPAKEQKFIAEVRLGRYDGGTTDGGFIVVMADHRVKDPYKD